ncbi:hypothetical protein T492DRAFT_912225, partial [Pavlovales sp. CCMP2436]
MYDVIALVACCPTLSALLFDPVEVTLAALAEEVDGPLEQSVSLSSLNSRSAVTADIHPRSTSRVNGRRLDTSSSPRSTSPSFRQRVAARFALRRKASVHAAPNGTRRQLPPLRLIGQSAEVHGVRCIPDLRIFLHRGIARGIGVQHEYTVQQHVLYATVNSPTRPG